MKRAFFLLFLFLTMILTGCSGDKSDAKEKNSSNASAGIADDAPFLYAVKADFKTDAQWETYKTGCQAIENGDFAKAKTELNKIVGVLKGNESYIYALAREAEAANKKDDALHYYNMIVGVRDADKRHEALIQNDFEYTELADGTLSIAKYTGNEMYLRIPAQIGGKTVTAISQDAFKDNRNIYVVHLPDTIRSLGQNAFHNCINLNYINIPEDVTEIPDYCFCNTALFEISLPSTLVSIGNYAITASKALCYVFVPEGVTTLGEAAIVGNDFGERFTVVHLPSTITEITSKSISAGAVYHAGNEAVQAAFPKSITGTREDALNHIDQRIERASTVPSPLMSGKWIQQASYSSRGGQTLSVCIVDPKAPAGSVFALCKEYDKVGEITVIQSKHYPITLEGIEAVLSSNGRGLKLSAMNYSR